MTAARTGSSSVSGWRSADLSREGGDRDGVDDDTTLAGRIGLQRAHGESPAGSASASHDTPECRCTSRRRLCPRCSRTTLDLRGVTSRWAVPGRRAPNAAPLYRMYPEPRVWTRRPRWPRARPSAPVAPGGRRREACRWQHAGGARRFLQGPARRGVDVGGVDVEAHDVRERHARALEHGLDVVERHRDLRPHVSGVLGLSVGTIAVCPARMS